MMYEYSTPYWPVQYTVYGDYDYDGIIDEQRDNDKGVWLECNSENDCGLDDPDLFYSFYNKHNATNTVSDFSAFYSHARHVEYDV